MEPTKNLKRLTDYSSRTVIQLPHIVEEPFGYQVSKSPYALAEYEIVLQSKGGIKFYALEEILLRPWN